MSAKKLERLSFRGNRKKWNTFTSIFNKDKRYKTYWDWLEAKIDRYLQRKKKGDVV